MDSLPRLKSESARESDGLSDRQRENLKKIKALFDEVPHYAQRVERVIASLGKGRKCHAVTEQQFKLLEWATKQLEIRRLKAECSDLFEELDASARE